MKQLIMNWTNDGIINNFPVLPKGIEIKSFHELNNALSIWLDIIRYLSQEGKKIDDSEYYKKYMLKYPNYNDERCYILTINGAPAATITVICDYSEKSGYIHMVACKPEFRGMGLGHLLNNIAIYTLKKEGMKTAYLTTDDWRIPAIKTYLNAGFIPDLDSEPDYKERWKKIFSIINT